MKPRFFIGCIIIAILAISTDCPAGAEKNHICFRIIDADQDGRVTLQEFKQYFDNAKEKFAAVDLNGDGRLSHDEYHQSLGHGVQRKETPLTPKGRNFR